MTEQVLLRASGQAEGVSHPGVVLLATDGSEESAIARRAAVDLTGRGAWRLHLVHAWQAPIPFPFLGYLTPVDYPREYADHGGSVLTDERHRAEGDGAEVTADHLAEGRPADAILRVADAVGAGLIVIGSRGLGRLERLALGTVSEEVVHQAHRPVLVTRGGAEAWPPTHVVAADDRSSIAAQAARVAGVLAGILEVPLVLIEVVPHFDRAVEDGLRDRAREIESATGASVRTRLAFGPVAERIVDHCTDDGARPLLACGSRGAGLFQCMRLGSVSRRLLHAAQCPILIVPPPGGQETSR